MGWPKSRAISSLAALVNHARWKLDDLTGSIASDSMGAHPGTIYGLAAWVNRVSGPFGVGYENNPGDAVNYTDLIGLDVKSQMYNKMQSCYIRIPFVLTVDPAKLTSLTLKIRCDDGFVAYINGQELARDRFAAPVPAWNAGADSSCDDAVARTLQPFTVNRSDKPDLFNSLQLGNNILAIHGLNYLTSSSDFLISEELYAGQ